MLTLQRVYVFRPVSLVVLSLQLCILLDIEVIIFKAVNNKCSGICILNGSGMKVKL
jgi:hypothetical protein